MLGAGTITIRPAALGSGVARLSACPFEVRYSDGALVRARAAAGVAAEAYVYFSHLFTGVEPDIAIIVAGKADWQSRQPYGLPFFNDDDGQIRPGIVVLPAGSGFPDWNRTGHSRCVAARAGEIACGMPPWRRRLGSAAVL